MNTLDSGYPGGYLAGSSNGSATGTGIVWALTGDNESFQAGTLRAYDASDVSSQLWTSDMNASRDAAGAFAKDLPSLVVNGRVYVGNFSSQLVVYGLLSGQGTGPVTMSHTSSTNPSVYNQAVTLTAVVSPPGATGTISFMEGATLLGLATVMTGSAALPGVVLAAGPHSLSAVYSGDSIYAGGTAALNQTVSKATPTITWTASAAITFGSALSSLQLDATASVPGSFVYSPPAGTVLPAGNGQSLSASFTPGDTTNYNMASAATTINVNPAPPAADANLVVTKVLTRSGENIVVQLTIANTGGTAVSNVSLTSVKLGTTTAAPLPQSLGTVAGGGSVAATVTVPGSVGASGAASSLSVGGSYTGGSFSSSARISLP
jgi:hypothetical protein